MPLHTGRNTYADPPSLWLVEHAAQLPQYGRVLDLACGRGRHTRWLAERGFQVLAVDIDADALAGLAGLAGVSTAQHDLESGAWPLGQDMFAGIVVCRYLHRPLLPAIARALAPGGVLIYETFMQGHELYNSPRRPEFLLASGELMGFAAQYGLEVLDFAEGPVDSPRPAVLQAICARRRLTAD